MEALKTKGIARDGILTIHVPEEFEGRTLDIIVLPADEQSTSDIEKTKKITRLLSVIGTAKDLNKTFDKHDVYDQ